MLYWNGNSIYTKLLPNKALITKIYLTTNYQIIRVMSKSVPIMFADEKGFMYPQMPHPLTFFLYWETPTYPLKTIYLPWQASLFCMQCTNFSRKQFNIKTIWEAPMNGFIFFSWIILADDCLRLKGVGILNCFSKPKWEGHSLSQDCFSFLMWSYLDWWLL